VAVDENTKIIWMNHLNFSIQIQCSKEEQVNINSGPIKSGDVWSQIFTKTMDHFCYNPKKPHMSGIISVSKLPIYEKKKK